MERRHPAIAPTADAVHPGPPASSARLRLAALQSPAEAPPPLPGIPLSEAITAHHRTSRPTWVAAFADRLPLTLRGRWGIDAKAAIALACVALAGALLGGWYLWQAQPTVIDLPGGPGDPSPRVVVAGAVPESSSAGSVASVTASSATLPRLPQDSVSLVSTGAGPAGLPQGTSSPSAGAAVVVDVEGKVARPGIESLPTGSRVYEALRAAGGPSAGVDLTGLDLARPLVDGEQLRVGLPGPVAPSGPTASAAPGGPKSKRGKPAQPVNLNTATLEQLETVPDIGPAMAQRIIDWRGEHGRFASVNQLTQVRGIGQRKFADIKDSVTVS